MIRAADFDLRGRYRYSLERIWAPSAGLAVWIMLNPSTADTAKDDPTIRRCMAFARAWGYGGIVVVNLFAYRATDFRALKRLRQDEAIGPQNDRAIAYATHRPDAKLVIAAWGVHGGFYGRDREVRDLLAFWRVQVKCLCGQTKRGHPRHPLYVPGRTEPTEFQL